MQRLLPVNLFVASNGGSAALENWCKLHGERHGIEQSELYSTHRELFYAFLGGSLRMPWRAILEKFGASQYRLGEGISESDSSGSSDSESSGSESVDEKGAEDDEQGSSKEDRKLPAVKSKQASKDPEPEDRGDTESGSDVQNRKVGRSVLEDTDSGEEEEIFAGHRLRKSRLKKSSYILDEAEEDKEDEDST